MRAYGGVFDRRDKCIRIHRPIEDIHFKDGEIVIAIDMSYYYSLIEKEIKLEKYIKEIDDMT